MLLIVPVAVTFPELMTAVSPLAGTPVGDQSAAFVKLSLAPFQVFVVISQSSTCYFAQWRPIRGRE
jgi:hypothetical protein